MDDPEGLRPAADAETTKLPWLALSSSCTACMSQRCDMTLAL
jgi:hypothetical protein